MEGTNLCRSQINNEDLYVLLGDIVYYIHKIFIKIDDLGVNAEAWYQRLQNANDDQRYLYQCVNILSYILYVDKANGMKVSALAMFRYGVYLEGDFYQPLSRIIWHIVNALTRLHKEIFQSIWRAPLTQSLWNVVRVCTVCDMSLQHLCRETICMTIYHKYQSDELEKKAILQLPIPRSVQDFLMDMYNDIEPMRKFDDIRYSKLKNYDMITMMKIFCIKSEETGGSFE